MIGPLEIALFYCLQNFDGIHSKDLLSLTFSLKYFSDFAKLFSNFSIECFKNMIF